MNQSTIDEVRTFWNKRPCNIRHSLATVGSKRWSDEVTKRKYFVESHIPDFAQFWRWRRKTVIEIGCGIGTDTLEFARHGVETIWALDLSQVSLDLLRKRITWFENTWLGKRRPEIIPVCCDAETEFPLDRADLVYAFGSLHHAPHPEKILANAYAALKPGGEMRAMVYAKYSIKNIIRQQPEAQKGCPIVRTFTVREARRLFESAGFEVESIRKDHIFPYSIPEYIEHKYVKVFPYNRMPEGLFAWLEKRLGWHLLITARKPT